MKRHTEALIIGVSTALIFILSMAPWYMRISRTPAGHDFIPVHNSLSDYPFYTSIIKQGLEGDRSLVYRFTSEPHDGGYVPGFYLFLGWVGGLLGLDDAHAVYHGSRYVLGALYVIVLYAFIRTVLSSRTERIGAFLLALVSASFPAVLQDGRLGWHMTWWTELDPMQRIVFLPHYLFGHILHLSILALIFGGKGRTIVHYLCILALSVLAGFVHPPSLLIILATLPFLFPILKRPRHILLTGFALGGGLLALLFILRQYQVFPWVLSRAYESVSYNFFIRHYILALGPIVPLAFAGLLVRLRNPIAWYMAIWFTLSVVLIMLTRLMPSSSLSLVRDLAFSDIRFLQVAPWIPLSILAASGAHRIIQKFGRYAGITLWTVIAVVTFIGYPQAIRMQGGWIPGGMGLSYPSPGYLDAIREAGRVTEEGDVILAMPLAGQMIPSYTNRTVYVGNQPYYTADLGGKMDNAWALYRGLMTPCESYRFLIANNISTVFYGYDEKQAGDAVKRLGFLLPWKRLGETEVYRVIQAPPPGCTP